MRKSLIAFVAASSVTIAAVTAPTEAEARWRGWGPAYYSYGYPAYSYGYPAFSYGYYPRYRYRWRYAAPW
jgi:hypothetical protein